MCYFWIFHHTDSASQAVTFGIEVHIYILFLVTEVWSTHKAWSEARLSQRYKRSKASRKVLLRGHQHLPRYRQHHEYRASYCHHHLYHHVVAAVSWWVMTQRHYNVTDVCHHTFGSVQSAWTYLQTFMTIWPLMPTFHYDGFATTVIKL